LLVKAFIVVSCHPVLNEDPARQTALWAAREIELQIFGEAPFAHKKSPYQHAKCR
jgi:hypothetical protein